MCMSDTGKTFQLMRKAELTLLIIDYNKGSQIDRSFSKTKLTNKKKKEFRNQLIIECLALIKMIDLNRIKNKDIRDSIDRLTSIDNCISCGQAQKVINVLLKQYCFITNKHKIVKELDCPLDSITMKGTSIKNKKMINVRKADYLQYQAIFERTEKIKVFKDLDYDNKRISNFLE